MEIELRKQSIADLKKLAENLASFLSTGDIVLLNGELGSGKTALVKFVVDVLSTKDTRVTSPTFNIVQIYNDESLKYPIYHFDAYRLEGVGGMDQGYEDYLYGNGISFVEWPEYIADIIPDEKAIEISFQRNQTDPDFYRDIKIKSENKKFTDFINLYQ